MILSKLHGSTSPVYTGSDSFLAIASKKLSKKDEVTRLKGFAEVETILKERGNEVFADFIPYYVYLFPKIGFDNSPRCRLQLMRILSLLMTINAQAFGDHMKFMIGTWWLLRSDPVEEVSSMASQVFESSIPKKKLPKVLVYLSNSILDNIGKNITSRPDSLSDLSSCSPEEAEDRYHRVIYSCLNGVGLLCSSLTSEDNQALLPEYHKILVSSTWKKAKDKNPQIRLSTYRLLSNVSKHLQSYLSDLVSRTNTTYSIAKFNSNLLAILNEDENKNLSDMFAAFTSILNAFTSVQVAGEAYQWWKEIAFVDVMKVIRKMIDGKSTLRRKTALGYLPNMIACWPAQELSWSLTKDNPSLVANHEAIFSFIDGEYQRKFTEGDATLAVDDKTEAADIIDTLSCLVEVSAVSILRNVAQISDLKLTDILPSYQRSLRLVVSILSQSFEVLVEVSTSTTQGSNTRAQGSTSSLSNNDFFKTLRAVMNQLIRGSARNILLSTSLWKECVWQPLSLMLCDYYGELLDIAAMPVVESLATSAEGSNCAAGSQPLSDDYGARLDKLELIVEKVQILATMIAEICPSRSLTEDAVSIIPVAIVQTSLRLQDALLQHIFAAKSRLMTESEVNADDIMALYQYYFKALTSTNFCSILVSWLNSSVYIAVDWMVGILRLLHFIGSIKISKLSSFMCSGLTKSLIENLAVMVENVATIEDRNQLEKLTSEIIASSRLGLFLPWINKLMYSSLLKSKSGRLSSQNKEVLNKLYQDILHALFQPSSFMSINSWTCFGDCEVDVDAVATMASAAKLSDKQAFLSRLVLDGSHNQLVVELLSNLDAKDLDPNRCWLALTAIAGLINISFPNLIERIEQSIKSLLVFAFLDDDDDDDTDKHSVEQLVGRYDGVSSWDDACDRILHRLPLNISQSFLNQVISQVSLSHHSTSFEQSPRHIIRLLGIIQTSSTVPGYMTLQTALKDLGFGSDLWTNLASATDLSFVSPGNTAMSVCFLLQQYKQSILPVFHSSAKPSANDVLSILRTFRNLETRLDFVLKGTILALQRAYLGCLGEFSDADKHRIISEVLHLLRVSDTSTYNYEDVTTVIRIALGDSSEPTVNISLNLLQPSSSSRINVAIPLPSQALKSGQTVHYIKQSALSDTNKDSSRSSFPAYRYELIEAVVVACHKESGSLPYYSIQIPWKSDASQDYGFKELQTEWHR
jgi:hypothetical protein